MNPTRRSLLARTAAAATGAGAASLAACGFAGAAAPPAPVPRGPKGRECIWFPSGGDGQFCCGMLHRPPKSIADAPGVLLLHGLVGAKDQPHRMFVTLADALARAGFIALRFDLRGRGDSEGQSIDATPKRDLEDATNGLRALAAAPGVDPQHLIVLGMSWGGTLAAHLAADMDGVRRVILWSSCPADSETWKPRLREIDGKPVADVFGNLLSKTFYDGVVEMTPLSHLKKRRQPVLMVYGTQDELIPRNKFDAAKTELEFADVSVTTVPVEGADHAFMRHEWEKKAIDETVAWIARQ